MTSQHDDRTGNSVCATHEVVDCPMCNPARQPSLADLVVQRERENESCPTPDRAEPSTARAAFIRWMSSITESAEYARGMRLLDDAFLEVEARASAPEQGEPPAEWECGTERDGGRCSRPSGHKGMHRKRSMIGPSKEELYAAYEAGRAASSGGTACAPDVERLMVEHRQCGTPNGYDGCYAHFPMPHCRADGMAWPCDVDALRAALHPESSR